MSLTVLFLMAAVVLPAADDVRCADCGDFLAYLQKKPAHLEFVKCQHEPDEGGGESWLTTYRVPGPYAVQVESYLVQNFRLPRLKKTCCAWGNGEHAGYYEKGKDRFEISMEGEDTGQAFTSTRADWHKLPFFYVSVQHYKTEIANQ